MTLTSSYRISCRSIFKKMVSNTKVQLVPADVRGMKVLDRDKFARNFEVPTLKVSNAILSNIINICKEIYLKVENFKPVQSYGDDNTLKCIYLNPEIIAEWSDISKEKRQSLNQHNIDEKNFEITQIKLSYENWKHETIFKAVLPENEEIISGFSQIGHIIHLNLRDHLLEYRYVIGEVLLDKIKTCRTVVYKSNIIDNTYRNFSMEVIAGENDFLVTVKENRCNFKFDFSKVYWNPRLCKEHERILSVLKSGDVLFDVFCGVGPFAVPAVRKKCKVFANDLNPESFKWLNHNAVHNKINMTNFKSYNLDGAEFIKDIFKSYLIDLMNEKQCIQSGSKIYITMNLPAMAVEFLKYFENLIDDQEGKYNLDYDIIVYVYCFVTGDNVEEQAKTLINNQFECEMSKFILDVFHVRTVSPKKDMMRVTIKLTKDVIFTTQDVDLVPGEPPVKKPCVNID